MHSLTQSSTACRSNKWLNFLNFAFDYTQCGTLYLRNCVHTLTGNSYCASSLRDQVINNQIKHTDSVSHLTKEFRQEVWGRCSGCMYFLWMCVHPELPFPAGISNKCNCILVQLMMVANECDDLADMIRRIAITHGLAVDSSHNQLKDKVIVTGEFNNLYWFTELIRPLVGGYDVGYILTGDNVLHTTTMVLRCGNLNCNLEFGSVVTTTRVMQYFDDGKYVDCYNSLTCVPQGLDANANRELLRVPFGLHPLPESFYDDHPDLLSEWFAHILVAYRTICPLTHSPGTLGFDDTAKINQTYWGGVGGEASLIITTDNIRNSLNNYPNELIGCISSYIYIPVTQCSKCSTKYAKHLAFILPCCGMCYCVECIMIECKLHGCDVQNVQQFLSSSWMCNKCETCIELGCDE